MKTLPTHFLINGDCLEELKKLETQSLDAMVTDPPAGIGFHHLKWDEDKGGRDQWIAWLESIMRECHRILKPGAHAFVWAIPRTSHWTATALENAGFEVRDVITHVFGTGFPKGLAIDKAILKSRVPDLDTIYKVTGWIKARRDELGLSNAQIDLATGAHGLASHWTAILPNKQPQIPTPERWKLLESVLGSAPEWLTDIIYSRGTSQGIPNAKMESEKWRGWGTALKPVSEHWILARKPLASQSIVNNVLKFSTGAINIDSCRTPTTDEIQSTRNAILRNQSFFGQKHERSDTSIYQPHPNGRYPTNFVVTRSSDESCPVRALNEMGQSKRGVAQLFPTFETEPPFYYCKKAGESEKARGNEHPTVKPIALMKYLCRLITPPNGKVLDPFMGSGTTGVAALAEGFQFIGLEKEVEYFSIAKDRITTVEMKVLENVS